MRLQTAALAGLLLLLAAAAAGCTGSEDEAGAASGTDPTPAGDGTTSGDDGNATDPDGGNGTAESPSNETASGSGNATDGNGTAPNATDGPQPGDVVDTGHIQVGSPTTRHFLSLTVAAGQEGVESFRFEEAPPPGTVVATNTTDNSGLGYDLDVWFHDADGGFLGGCSSNGGEETCTVPDGAAQGTVDAYRGADLDVVLYVETPP